MQSYFAFLVEHCQNYEYHWESQALQYFYRQNVRKNIFASVLDWTSNNQSYSVQALYLGAFW